MARQTLTMAITLEGADKVEADLSKLGPAAEKAFNQIKAAADRAGSGLGRGVSAGVQRFQQQLQLLQASGQRLGRAFNTFTLATDTFSRAIDKTAIRIGLLGAAIGGVIGGLGAFAKSTAANAERIDNQAKSLGVSVEAYQNFETAAKNAGLEQGTFDQILTRFVTTAAEAGTTAGDAAKGTDDLAKGIRKVEVTAADGSKKLITIRGTSDALADSIRKVGTVTKGSEQDLVAFAKRITSIQDPLQRLRAVIDAGFSKKQAPGVVTFLRAVANDADDVARAASKTIGPLSQLEIAAGVNLDNAFDRLGTNMQRTKDRLLTLFAPALTAGIDRFADLIYENKTAIEEFANAVKDKALVVVQDLIAAFSGRDADVQNTWVLTLRDGIIELGTAAQFAIFNVVVPAFQALLDILDTVATGINSVFGTEFTGASLLITAAILKIIGAFTLLKAAAAVTLASINLLREGLRLLIAAPVVAQIGLITLAVGALAKAGVDAKAKLEELAGVNLPTMAITPVIANPPTAPLLLALTYWEDLRKAVRDYFGLIDDSSEPVFAGFIAATQGAFEQVKSLGSEAIGFLVSTFSEGGVGKAFLDAERASFEKLWEIVRTSASAAFEAMRSAAEGAISAISGFIDGLISKIRQAISALISLASARSQSVEGTGGGSGFARGGSVRGPGTGTSDSIPAWLSAGEFVIRAAAVRKWGAGFFATLNSLRMPKGGLQMHAGGLAAQMSYAVAPRFANGGPVQTRNTATGRPLTLVVDNERIDGLTASRDAVEQLMKFSTGKKLRSNGRKPSWYGN